jgi:adenylosuccinate lyase
MIPRYEDAGIRELFSDIEKLKRWDEVELAVIKARVNLGQIPGSTFEAIKSALKENPADLAWWHTRDSEIHHDLNAYLDERRRHIPLELQSEFHRDMTSYDTEEPAQAIVLDAAALTTVMHLSSLESLLGVQAAKYRHTIMLRRTHGQGAKLGSFGGRILTWLAELQVAKQHLLYSLNNVGRSRIAGAIGNYGGNLSPELEEMALSELNLNAFTGATQITPRVLTAPLAFSLYLCCEVMGKIAHDFRLMARSGLPLCHEPFAKKQKGSSAMPHKKNTINTEQMEGMVRLAKGYSTAIVEGVKTWEERAIEQSCVERVAWPDLFHVTIRMAQVMTKVIGGMVVYPDNMLREIVESRGTYASDEAKNYLAEIFSKLGVPAEEAYRIVQLASFCALQPKGFWAQARVGESHVLTPLHMDSQLDHAIRADATKELMVPVSIRDLIFNAKLYAVPDLEATLEEIGRWNRLLKGIFNETEDAKKWWELFQPSNLIRGEDYLFTKILG